MNGVVIKRLIAYRREMLVEDAAGRARAFSADSAMAAATDTPDAERVLRNFLEHFVRAA